jgi:hypothetical protein
MDEETRAYLDGMMAQINDKFERVLDEIITLRAAIVLGPRVHRPTTRDHARVRVVATSIARL